MIEIGISWKSEFCVHSSGMLFKVGIGFWTVTARGHMVLWLVSLFPRIKIEVNFLFFWSIVFYIKNYISQNIYVKSFWQVLYTFCLKPDVTLFLACMAIQGHSHRSNIPVVDISETVETSMTTRYLFLVPIFVLYLNILVTLVTNLWPCDDNVKGMKVKANLVPSSDETLALFFPAGDRSRVVGVGEVEETPTFVAVRA